MNLEPNLKENCTEIVTDVFTMNNYCAENVTGMFTINNGKESAEIKYFGNTPRPNDRIEYESTKYSYDDKRPKVGIEYETNKYSYDENSEVKYFGSQPRKKYRLDRTKNDADLQNYEGPDIGKNAKVHFGKDYG